jgi:NAD+ synthase (glutamine-hydrolysing)
MQGARVLFCPEMSVPGYLIGDAWERPAFHSAIARAHSTLAAEAHRMGVALVFGSLGVDASARGEDGRQRRYNAAFVTGEAAGAASGFLSHPRTRLPFFPKTLLPAYREFDDPRHFHDLRRLARESGTLPEELAAIVEFAAEDAVGGAKGPTLRAGLSLCEDGWDDDYALSPLAAQARLGARALFNLSCSPYTFGKRAKRLRLFSGKARSLGVPLFYVNAVGAQNVGKTVYGFDGGSLAFDAAGQCVYEGGFFREELAVFDVAEDGSDVSLVAVDTLGEAFTSFPNVPSARPSADATSDSNANAAHEFDDALERIAALENVVSFVCEEWGIGKLVVGVSGGVDSAVSATLFARVLGPSNVACVNMPSRFNSDLTRGAARALCDALGCPFAEAPIQASVDLTLAQLSALTFVAAPGSSSPPPALALTPLLKENVQARDRSARLLSGIAAGLGAVFPCNANKAEATVGYSTLYGDQSGFLSPIGDLWKHEVYALARAYNQRVFGNEVIPRATLEVVPSAELSDAQDVMRGMGDPIAYPYHDHLFRSWVERWERASPEDALEAWIDGRLEEALGCEPGLVARLFATPAEFVSDLERWWKAYVGMGAFKRVQAPPVVALSRRAFGFDHRECIGAYEWSERWQELKARALDPSLPG